MADREIKAVARGGARRCRRLNQPPHGASLVGLAAGLEPANGEREGDAGCAAAPAGGGRWSERRREDGGCSSGRR